MPRDSSYDQTDVGTPGVEPSTTLMVIKPINSGPTVRSTADVNAATNGAGTTTQGICDAQIVRESL